MEHVTLTLLNAAILTSYGTFRFEPISLERARELVQEFQRPGKRVQSAIGHQSTADLLTVLLGIPVQKDRMELNQTVEDLALVFKLSRRPPEGKVLTREEIEEIGYEFGLMTRLE